jgi:hypothetical protein
MQRCREPSRQCPYILNEPQRFAAVSASHKWVVNVFAEANLSSLESTLPRLRLGRYSGWVMCRWHDEPNSKPFEAPRVEKCRTTSVVKNHIDNTDAHGRTCTLRPTEYRYVSGSTAALHLKRGQESDKITHGRGAGQGGKT